MIIYKIPGRKDIVAKNLVLDYNGTIAAGGSLLEGVAELVELLSQKLDVYVLTADTYGTVKKQCEDLKAQVLSFPRENAGQSKKEIVEKLGKENTICLGNGFNDIPMFEVCALSIAVLEKEGSSGKLLAKADIVTRSIVEALELLINEMAVRATLRN